MSALKIVGIVLGAVVLLLLILLALPVRIKIKLDEKGKYLFKIMLVFIPLYSEYSGKEEKKKVKKSSSEKKKKGEISLRLKDLFGLRELLDGKDAEEAFSEGIRIIKNVLREIADFLPGAKIEKLKVSAVFSESDPAKEAMIYGIACAAVYPFIGFVKSFMKVREKGTHVDMRCSFGKEEPSVDFEVIVVSPVLKLLKSIIKLIMEEAKNSVMKEGIK